jgi:hypothetical protein
MWRVGGGADPRSNAKTFFPFFSFLILYRMDIATMEICFYVANTNTKDRRKRRLLDEIGRHAEAMRKAVEELARIVHEEERRRREASALAELVHNEERRRREASRATEA